MSLNVKLILAYDGTNYYGWQKTPTGPSIEETLQNVLQQILNHPIILQAASRTDRGVHALGQVVNFFTDKALDYHKFMISINSLLPKDIVVRSVEAAAEDFHPTLQVQSKVYTYEICYGPVQLPQHRLYSWHYHYALDIELMIKAATFLIGTHDFSAFSNFKKNETYVHHIRSVQEISIESHEENRLLIAIKGNHFLYKMVRNIVGTLAYVGNQRLPLTEIPEILINKDRTYAGVTAPAHGLTLKHIRY